LIYNEKTENFLICPLHHLQIRARIYKTESFFINKGLITDNIKLNSIR